MKKQLWKKVGIFGSTLSLCAMPTIASAQQAEENFAPIDNYQYIEPQAQVTSVSQLRDVSPTDWAYEALRSLVERYGCIVGYPDKWNVSSPLVKLLSEKISKNYND